MDAFFRFLAEAFREVLFMSLTALALGAAVLVAGRLLRNKIAPRWQRLMWLLVFLALLFPFRPESSVSLTSFAEPMRSFTFREDYTQSRQQYQVLPDNMQDMFRVTQTGREHNQLRIWHVIVDVAVPLVWFAGAVVFAIYMLIGGTRLKRRLLKERAEVDPARIKKLLKECKEQMGVSKDFEIVFQDHIKSPALLGVFKPKIILPLYVDEMDDQSVRYILFHELGHYKRFDMLINLVMMIVQALYWFNPAIRILKKYVRQDVELANDAYVLGLIGEEQKTDYSFTLVETLGRSGGIPSYTRLFCMADSSADMKRRLESLRLSGVHNKNRILAAIVSCALVSVLSLFFLTGSGEAVEHGSQYAGLPGNWIRVWDRGDGINITEIFIFGPDATVSVVSSHVDFRYRFYSGSYETDEINGILRMTYTHSGTVEKAVVRTVTPSYSLSADGQYLTISDDGHSAVYARTMVPVEPSVFGVWEGNHYDGTAVMLEFDVSGYLYVQTGKDGIFHDKQELHFNLSDGLLNFRLPTNEYHIGETLVAYPMQSAGILLSTDGNKLLLLDITGGEGAGFIRGGEMLELFRQG